MKGDKRQFRRDMRALMHAWRMCQAQRTRPHRRWYAWDPRTETIWVCCPVQVFKDQKPTCPRVDQHKCFYSAKAV